MMVLSQKQKRFAEEYVATGNITRSAINAGYSEKSAAATGRKVLENHSVKAYIEKLNDQLTKPTIASADEALQILTTILRGEREEEIVQLDPVSGKWRRTKKKPDNGAVLKAVGEIMKRHPLPIELNVMTPTTINLTLGTNLVDTEEPPDE